MSIRLNRVLITDEVDPKCIDILKNSGIDVDVNIKFAKDKAAFLAAIPNYDGLIVRSATKVTADVIEASNLSIIGRAGTGTDNIESDAATRKGVIVMNTPGGNTISAAELTCAMICALARNLCSANQSMKDGKWDRKLYMGEELQGKTLAVVGLGRIGREVANRMRSFGMKTIGYDPLVSAEESAAFNVTSYPLEELWPLADYITVHVPLIPQTANLINTDVLNKCKRGVKVVNCARGGIIDETALLDALNSGQCGGAGLDVFMEEPPTNYDLAKHPNVVATPHLGASTNEAQSRVAEEIALQFIDARNGKSLFGAINANAMIQAQSPESQPWVELGRSLGVLVGSLTTPPASLQVSVRGGLNMKKAVSYLQAAISSGVLSVSSSTKMNLINAPLLATEAGLKVQCQYENSDDCSVSLALDGSISVTGSVIGNTPMLTSINSSPLNVVLSKGAVFSLCIGVSDRQAVISQSLNFKLRSLVCCGDEVILLQTETAPTGLESLAKTFCTFKC